jgi:hypothetical protein
MARTHLKHFRAYVNGYDYSGYTRNTGPLNWSFSVEPDTALTDGVKNVILGQADITAGPISAFLDNTASTSIHAGLTQATRDVFITWGRLTDPAAGDPVFAWRFEDAGYKVEPGTGFLAATLPLGGASYAGTLAYEKPWGVLLHAKAARTAVNSATGIDDNGASSALGGVFAYQIFSSNGTVTIKAQHADTNTDGSFADLTGATSGVVNASTTPQYGMVALGTTLTVNRYLRWQLVFGTASTVTFACALIRNGITT